MSAELKAHARRVINALNQIAECEAGMFAQAETRGDEDGQDIHLYAEQCLRHAIEIIKDLPSE